MLTNVNWATVWIKFNHFRKLFLIWFVFDSIKSIFLQIIFLFKFKYIFNRPSQNPKFLFCICTVLVKANSFHLLNSHLFQKPLSEIIKTELWTIRITSPTESGCYIAHLFTFWTMRNITIFIFITISLLKSISIQTKDCWKSLK